MGEVVLARVDQRLIHGQIVTAIAPTSGGNSIILANDGVAGDAFLKSISETTGSSGNSKAQVLSLQDTIDAWNINQFGDRKVLLITKDIYDMKKLIDGGVVIEKLNIGNNAQKAGKINIINEVGLDEKEFNILKEINDNGAEVFVQALPSFKRVKYSEIANKF